MILTKLKMIWAIIRGRSVMYKMEIQHHKNNIFPEDSYSLIKIKKPGAFIVENKMFVVNDPIFWLPDWLL